MIRTINYSDAGKLQTDLNQIDVAFLLQEKKGLLWMDFQGAPDEETEPILRNTFGFHPLAIDDALQEAHVPKLDDWGDYLYIVLHAVLFDELEGDVDTRELDVFLGANYIVTHHDQPIDAVDRVWSAVQRDDRHLKSGPDHLLYRIVDEIAAGYMPVVEQFDLKIDELETAIFTTRDTLMLEKLFTIKRSVLFLRRVLAHQREVLNKLARDDYEVIDAADRVYFRDVYDHMVRLYDIIEGVRDLVGGTLDTYLSAINNRMNDIMTTLTMITTLFMPISFIASFYGMNFFQPTVPLNNWTGYPAFTITLIFFTLTPITMFLFMRRRKWM